VLFTTTRAPFPFFQFFPKQIQQVNTVPEVPPKDFHEGVDDYLAMCEGKNIPPEQPFKGSFNVRVGRDLHRQIALEAARRGVSLNNLVVAALEKETHHAA